MKFPDFILTDGTNYIDDSSFKAQQPDEFVMNIYDYSLKRSGNGYGDGEIVYSREGNGNGYGCPQTSIA